MIADYPEGVASMGENLIVAENDSSSDGKKIFFVYPNKPILENIVPGLIGNGYEPYLLDDLHYTDKVCSHYKNSVVLLNIDQSIKKVSWYEYIKKLKLNEAYGSIDIGIISEEDSDAVILNFSDFSFNVAYLSFIHGINFCRQVLLNILEKTNAKGKRRYVRVKCDNIYHASFSIKVGNHIIAGQICDISVAGMACTLSEKIQLHTGSVLNDIQLRLMGTIVSVSGKIVGTRSCNGMTIYVVMFNEIRDNSLQYRLVMFISHMLQENIKSLFLNQDKS
jgi:hypothetical protein